MLHCPVTVLKRTTAACLAGLALVASTYSMAAAGAPPHSLPAGVTAGARIEGVEEYHLANGLTVLLAPDPGKATMTVNVTYRVGSRHEHYGETGMAHLLEHMLFKGTPKHPDITGGLTRHGMRPNGTTWYDRTNYFETFPASAENLTWALEMEADRMVNSKVARSDLDSEMTVVRNEMERGENSPESVLSERTTSAAFEWHNYGKSTIGARSDVEGVSIDHLQAFYRTWYQPDNAVLVVAGRIDPESVLKEVASTFGAVPKPGRVLPATYTLEPVQDGERLVVLRRPGDVQHLNVVYHAMPAASKDFPAFRVLAAIIGDTPFGRLHRKLTAQGLATGTSATAYALAEPGMLEVAVDVKKDQSLAAAEQAALATLEGFATEPVTQEEVERARTRLLTQMDQTFADPERFGVALSGAIAAGDWRLFFLERDELRKVTSAQVQALAVAWLKPTNRTLGRFIPEDNSPRAPKPALVDVAARLTDYHPAETIAQGERFDPTPENIESRAQRSVLPGGLKLVLLPKTNRGRTVSARLALHWGTAESLQGQATVGQFAASLIDKGGAGLTRQQIRARFDQLQARVMIGGSATGASVAIETTHDNLPAVLALVTRLLREPSYPDSEFEQQKTEQLAGIEEGRKEPQSVAMNALGAHLNHYPPGDLRHSTSIEEDLADTQAVTLAQVRAFHARFFSAAHGELGVVGDFDADAVKKVVTEGLGNWPTAQAYAPVLEDWSAPRPARLLLQTPDKANAFFYARVALPVRDDDADAPLLTLGNFILGEGFLNSRLATRIRQKEGLSYGVGSVLHLNREVAVSDLSAYAIYAPENRAKLETAFREELARMLRDGFSAEEVEAARQALLQNRRLGRAQDGGIAGLLAEYARIGRTMAFSAASDARIASATADELNAAMRRHLDPAQLTLVFAGDFKDAATK